MKIGQGYYQELNPVLQPRRPDDLPRNPTQQQRDIYDQEMQAHNDWRRYRVVYSNNTPTPTVFK